ncbi:MAG: gamma-glutamylcyclotransferase family protein [Candidatus Sulfotelmatobacter sp.]
MRSYLFSYRTLMPGFAPAEISATVQRLRAVGRGRVRGWLYDLGDYPGAVRNDQGPIIEGQGFELPDDPDVLDRLDSYEEFDPAHPESSLFVRRNCSVVLEDGRKLTCWAYSYNRHPGSATSLINGDFAKSRAQKSR